MPFNVVLEGSVPIDQNRVETSAVKVIKSLNKLCCFGSILERDCNKVLFRFGRIVVVLPDEDNTGLINSLGMAVQAMTSPVKKTLTENCVTRMRTSEI